MAKKLQSSLAVEGELPEDGLAAYGDDGDDLMMALARKIVNGEAEDDEAETMEQVFAQARNAESEAETLLVDDGWKPVEPEAIPVNGNGHSANGNGDDDLLGIGPTVELEPAPVNGNGNGHHDDEATEPQQSLFSWAEFMVEEPVKRRNGKPQAASMSMFEWAMEQERETETVGAGR